MNILLTQEELEKAAAKRGIKYLSGFANIDEDLALCTGNEAMSDSQWIMEVQDSAEDYVIEHFSYEDTVLGLKDKQFIELCGIVGIENQAAGDGVHTLAAFTALNRAGTFSEILKAVKELDREGRESIGHLLPELIKEIDDSVASAEKDARREYVNGAYSGDWRGIEYYLAKELEAQSADISSKDNTVVITWDDETIKEKIADAYGRRDIRLAKKWCISKLLDDFTHYKNKEDAKRAERNSERERVKKYQAEQKKQADEERLAKIDAIKL